MIYRFYCFTILKSCTYSELCSRDVELETTIFVSSSKQGVQYLVWGKTQVIARPHKIESV